MTKTKIMQFRGSFKAKVSSTVRKPIQALEYLTIDSEGCLKRARTKRQRKFRAISDQVDDYVVVA